MLASRRVAALTIVLAGLGMVLSSLSDVPVAVRASVTAPLILVLPGLAWLSLVRSASLDLATRLTLSVVCSLALVIFTGLALNGTEPGLTTATWALALGLLTILPSAIRLCLADSTVPLPRVPIRSLLLVVPVALAIFGVVAAYDLALQSAAARRDGGFTQLWLVGDAAGCADDLEVGVASYERQAISLKLALLVDGQQVGDVSTLAIEPGQQWTTTIRPARPDAALVEARLTRSDQPDAPYRWARLDCGGSVATGEGTLP